MAAVDLDFARLVKRVLRPVRPGLAAARAAVEGIRAPGAAWGALAAKGVIPAAWVRAPRRWFEGPEGQVQRYPATVDACVAIGADPIGVESVERLALEFAGRLAAAGAGTADKLRWRVGGQLTDDPLARRPLEPTGLLHGMLLGVHENADTTVWEPGGPAWVMHDGVPRRVWPGRGDFTDGAVYGRITREISASELWHSAALYGYRFGDDARSIKDLSDPFEPLFEIWLLGYAIDALIGDTLVLLAPDAG